MSELSAPKPASDTHAGRSGRVRSADRIIFDLVLIAFVALFVFVAFDLRPDSGLVPLLVGIPTLGMLLVRATLDVLARGSEYHSAPPSEDESSTLDANTLSKASHMDLARAAQEEAAEDDELPSDRTATRRRRTFAVWCVGFVLVAMFGTEYLIPPFGLHTYFLPASVLALLVIFYVIRLSWFKIVTITAGVTVFMYYMLAVLLNVRL